MPNYSTLAVADLAIGQNIVVALHYPHSSASQGGEVTAITDDAVTLTCGTARIIVTFTLAQLSAGRVQLETAYAATECAEYGVTCDGEVDEHVSRSGMTSTLRCEAHHYAHCDRLDAISRRYPDSPSAPGWFDPAYAGESWDETY